jgi:hypothetical protein
MTVLAVHHRVTDRRGFWETLAQLEASNDGTVRIKQVLRNEDGDRAVTVWEGESLSAIEAQVDSSLGRFSESEYEAVKSAHERRLHDED